MNKHKEEYEEKRWKDIRVGDIIKIQNNQVTFHSYSTVDLPHRKSQQMWYYWTQMMRMD